MKVKSHYPPFCFESPLTGKKYIVCTGDGSGWIEVDRWYGWVELESMWDKITYGAKYVDLQIFVNRHGAAPTLPQKKQEYAP